MSTQNVKVARFARNVELDYFCDFQTLCCCMYSLDTFIQAYLIRRIEPSQGGQSTADNLKKYRKMGPNCKSAEEYTCEQVTITDKIYITILITYVDI